jgi:hypothetical protein
LTDGRQYKCNKCGVPIRFDSNVKSPKTGRAIPLNMDGTHHDCQGKFQQGSDYQVNIKLPNSEKMKNKRTALMQSFDLLELRGIKAKEDINAEVLPLVFEWSDSIRNYLDHGND